ncbi:MAG: DUF309 domain-containing protein [Vampirovibrionales bacterium]|nr:DUF309 domain-containing protein [Vampirovibrionales bacterium]
MSLFQDPLLQDGLVAFESADYFKAHEFWEDLWRLMPEEAPFKSWLQGLIQLAVGLHHWQRGNLSGAKSVLDKAIKNLSSVSFSKESLIQLSFRPASSPEATLCPQKVLELAQSLQHHLMMAQASSLNPFPELPLCSLRGL